MVTIEPAIWAAAIGAASALLTKFWIEPRIDRKKQRAEERRWYLNHFLPLRVSQLHELHSQVVHSRNKIMKYYNLAESVKEIEGMPGADKVIAKYDAEFHSRVGVKYGPLDEAVAKALVFLSEDERKDIRKFETHARIIRLHISHMLRRETLPEDCPPVQWSAFETAFNRVQEVIAHVLSPTQIFEQSRKP